MITRPAKLNDTSQLFTLLKHMKHKGSEVSLEEIKVRIAAFNTERQQLIVAEEEGLLVGVIAFACYEQFRIAGSCCHVDTLVVHQDYRGQGIGHKLLALAEEYAIKHGATDIELITANHRRPTGTHSFYEAQQYKNHEELDYTYFRKELPR